MWSGASGVAAGFMNTGQLRELDDYNHFSPETQRVVFEQIERLVGL